MTQAFVDPQLAAFWASDPSTLNPEPAASPVPEHRRRLALEIAAASIVAVKVIRDRLRARPGSVADAQARADAAWLWHRPSWIKLVGPALLNAFRADRAGLSEEQLAAMATEYAGSIGDYFGSTSADAVQTGLQQQVASGVNDRIAWQRVVEAYGLDGRAMRGYVSSAMVAAVNAPTVIITASARTMIDKATLLRADLLGQSESWTAMETAKAMSWLYLQRAGKLPANAMREWDTAEDERTCSLCGPLDKMQVPLSEWFEVPGAKLWAPQAHPGCRCHIKLVVPEVAELTKAYDPNEPRARKGREGAGRWVETKTRTHDQVVDDIMEQARTAEQAEPVVSPFTALANSPFAATVNSPFRNLAGSPFTNLTSAGFKASPLGARHQAQDSPFTARAEALRTALRARRGTVNRVIVTPPPRRKRTRPPVEFFMPIDQVNMADETQDPNRQVTWNEDLDFSRLQADSNFRLRATHQHAWQSLDMNAMYAKRHMEPDDPAVRAAVVEAWYPAAQKAWGIWNHVRDNPDVYLSRLDTVQVKQIRDISGLDSADEYDGQMTDPWTRDTIRRELDRGLGVGDSSLARAFLDYVAWQQPQMVSEGRDLDHDLTDYREVGLYLADDPVEQVLVFNPADSRKNDVRKDHIMPNGHYAASFKTYRSALEDFHGEPPPLCIGLQEVHMVPYHAPRPRWYEDE